MPACCKNDTHCVTKTAEERQENTAFHIFSLFKGSVPVGALKVPSIANELLGKSAQGMPSPSHHSFTRFAAFNAAEASSEPVENEASAMTSPERSTKRKKTGNSRTPFRSTSTRSSGH